VIPHLPGRKIAPDLIGFGRSDKPADVGWYSYDRHVDSVRRVIEELELSGLTLVVHDWGGPIGLRLAVEHPERVDRLVLLNTAVGGGRAPSETWLRFREVVRKLGTAVDVGRLVEAGTAQGLSDEARRAYDEPFPTPESKAGVLAFPELVPAEPELRDWHKPALVVWGAEDPVLPPSFAAHFSELIPGAGPPLLIAGASHFLQEDRPAEVAEAIRNFVL
jgi:haloalkane dehalogenase